MLNRSVFFRRERGCFHLPCSFSFHSYVCVRSTILFPPIPIGNRVHDFNFFSSFERHTNPKEFLLSYSSQNIYFVLNWTYCDIILLIVRYENYHLHRFEGKSWWKVKISLESYFWISLDIALTVKVILEQSLLATQYSDCKIFG